MSEDPKNKKTAGNKSSSGKNSDTSLLKTVASELFSDTIPPFTDESVDDDLDDDLTMLMSGEVPPPPDEIPPPPDATIPPPPPDATIPPPPPGGDKTELAMPGDSGMPRIQNVGAPKMVPENEPAGEKGKQDLFKKRMPLGEILIRHNVITREELDYALKYQKENARDKKLGELLFQLKILEDNRYDLLINALFAQLKQDQINLDEVGQFVDFDLMSKVKFSRMEKENFFPLRIVEVRGSRTLEVFMDDAADLNKIDELAAIFGVSRVKPIGNFDSELLKSLTSDIKRDKALEIKPEGDKEITVLQAMDMENVDQDAIQRGREDNYISRITDKIIYDGVQNGASDIHVEYGDVPRVRYRVDGILSEGGWISPEDYPAVVSRLKIMSEMDISERRVPQDGNIRLGIEGMGVIDFRVNTIPVAGNEKVCLRILDGNKLQSLTLDMLGFTDEMLDSFISMISKPQGMVLITGPTGSGKSTTLYSSLLYLLESRGKEMNICTAEDPIEYKIEGLNQTQLNERVGLTFPKILKALLRQDPDIILVGEIRDLETAGLGVKASQTGHLVLSTLHTNTAVATIGRLVNMGIESYLVAETVLAVMNQRLARRICKNCSQPYTPPSKELAMILPKDRDQYTFIHGDGCSQCGHRGYKGRIGFYEYLRVSRDLKRMIINKGSEEEVLYQARDEGFLTLREYGLRKVQEGLTTLDEVLRHTIDQFE